MEQQPDFFNEMEDNNKLPSTLNVLTILTFIGSVFPIWRIISLASADVKLAATEEAIRNAASKQDMPEFARTAMENAISLVKLEAANKIPLMVCAGISLLLCVFGAIQMRNRKMMGYYLYLFGEILPFLGGGILIGSLFFNWINMGSLFMMLASLVFIILYSVQRKHLTK